MCLELLTSFHLFVFLQGHCQQKIKALKDQKLRMYQQDVIMMAIILLLPCQLLLPQQHQRQLQKEAWDDQLQQQLHQQLYQLLLISTTKGAPSANTKGTVVLDARISLISKPKGFFGWMEKLCGKFQLEGWEQIDSVFEWVRLLQLCLKKECGMCQLMN